MAATKQRPANTPPLEWISAAIGLILLAALLAIIGREALANELEALPAIEVRAARIAPSGTGFVVQFEAANRSSGTGAAVTIEGKLSGAGGEEETSTATLDYVPGESKVTGGLFFRQDPRRGTLDLRATGFQTP